MSERDVLRRDLLLSPMGTSNTSLLLTTLCNYVVWSLYRRMWAWSRDGLFYWNPSKASEWEVPSVDEPVLLVEMGPAREEVRNAVLQDVLIIVT